MRQLADGLAGSQIQINSARPGKAKQKEELTRTTKCQDEAHRSASSLSERRSLAPCGRENDGPLREAPRFAYGVLRQAAREIIDWLRSLSIQQHCRNKKAGLCRRFCKVCVNSLASGRTAVRPYEITHFSAYDPCDGLPVATC